MNDAETLVPHPHAAKDKYDVLEWDDLPQDECDMNYRLPIADPPTLVKRIVTLLLSCGMAFALHVLLTWLFVIFPALLAGGIARVALVAIAIGVLAALRDSSPTGRMRALRIVGGILGCGVLLSLSAGSLPLPHFLSLLLLATVGGIAWLADRIATSNAWWCTANPRVPQPVMVAYRDGWRRRWHTKESSTEAKLNEPTRRSVAQERVANELARYRIGLIWLAGSVFGGALVGLITADLMPGQLIVTPVLWQLTLVLIAVAVHRLIDATERLKGANPNDKIEPHQALQQNLLHVLGAISCHESYGSVGRQPPWVLTLPDPVGWIRHLQMPVTCCLLAFLTTACGLREHWPEEASVLWVFAIQLATSLLPVVWIAAGIAIVAGPSILAHRLALQVPGALEHSYLRSDWDGYVARLHESRNPLERQSVWVGCHLQHGYPILVDRSLYFEHAHVVGSAGSGKTALSLASDVTQLIRNCKGEDAAGGIVILDCKGDPALLHTAREEALAAGRKFRLFTNQPGRPTHGFNPLLHCSTTGLSLSETVGVIAQSLNLYHGEGYGRGFFGAASKALLQAAYKSSFTFGGADLLRPPIESFEQLEEILRDTSNDPKVFQAAQQLLYVVAALTEFEQINLTPGRGLDSKVLEESIHMPRLIRDGEVAYFYLVGMVDRSSVGHIARLVLYSTLAAAVDYRNQTRQPAGVYFFADEAQCLVSNNVAPLLEQARSYGVGCILAHQNMSQLEQADGKGLLELVLANTVIKRYHALRDPDSQKYVAAASGKSNYFDLSWDQLKQRAINRGQIDPRFACTGTDKVMRVGVTQTLGERIEIEELADMSRRLNQSAILVERNQGLTQLNGGVLVHADWPIAKTTYQRRGSTPWPPAEPGTIVCERGTPRPLPPAATTLGSSQIDERVREIERKKAKEKKPKGAKPPKSSQNDPESDQK